MNSLEKEKQLNKFYEKIKDIHKIYFPDWKFEQLIFSFEQWLTSKDDFYLDEELVDWTKVEVDTVVLVKNDWEPWHKEYFAKYDKEDGRVYVWYDGKTSQTTKVKISYKHTKLIKNESEGLTMAEKEYILNDQMKDYSNLDVFYEELKHIHKTHFPELRFGQMMYNFEKWLSLDYAIDDLYYVKNYKIVKYLNKYVERMKDLNGERK